MEQTNREIFPAFENNNIPVILSANNLYAPYAGVFIQSLLDNACEDKNYDIIIMERNISEQNRQLLKQSEQNRKNISIRFHDPSHIFESADVSSMETKDYPVEVYYKILAPYIFRNYSKIIVTDIDALLKRDIAELFDVDLEGFCLGAVLDMTREGNYKRNYVTLNTAAVRDYCEDVLKMENPVRYVNSGVLVFDVDKYCSYMDVSTILNTAQSKDLVLPDQDVLNLLFEGQIKFIDMAWNVFLGTNQRTRSAIDLASEESKAIYRQACAEPAILHWAGKPKPWVCPDVIFGHEWWHAAVRTPFVGHIIVRMLDALETRREYYMNRYGKKVEVWDPEPGNIDRKQT